MITIKDFMESVNYRITEGSEYCWSCFGPYAYRLDSWDGNTDGHTISLLFDTQSQEVYQAEAWDYANERYYRWQNPAHIAAHVAEAKSRDIDPDEASEGAKFVDLEVAADFLDKARSIVQGLDYDTRVQIEVELDDDVLNAAMRMAHERDITFNQLVEEIIQAKIDELKVGG